MSQKTIEIENNQTGFDAAVEALLAMRENYASSYLIVSSYEETIRCKKLIAKTPLALGVEVATLTHIVQDQWELFGDGRTLIDSAQRSFFVRRAFQEYLSEQKSPVFSMTEGTLGLLEEIVREGLPALEAKAGFNKAQQELVTIALQYGDAIEQAGFVESCTALSFLTEGKMLAQTNLVLLDVKTTVLEDRFIDSAGSAQRITLEGPRQPFVPIADELQAVQSSLFKATGENPVEPQGSVRFALPAGRYAAPSLIAREIVDLSAQGVATIGVAAADPKACFEALEARLIGNGIAVQVALSVPFETTDFGRAWCSLLSFIAQGNPAQAAFATDFALTAFSGLSVRGASICDARWRSWRGQTVEEALIDLMGFAGDGKEGFVALVDNKDYHGALQTYRDFIVSRHGWPEAYRIEQLQAVDQALTLYEGLASLDATIDEYLTVLKRTAISLQVEVVPEGYTSRVCVMSLAEMARVPAASFDAVCLRDLAMASYPLQGGLDAKEFLFEQLGIYKECDPLNDMREIFARAFAAARNHVVVSRPLATVDNEASLPAIVFDELVDCYRSDLCNPDELDRIYGLPVTLLSHVSTLGDESIESNLAPDDKSTSLAIEMPIYKTGFLSQRSSWKNTIIRSTVEGRPRLSASAIETYLECPHKWFITSRFDANGLDAGLGPLEFGSFAHLVLERFYTTFTQQGLERVTPDNLGQAQQLLGEVFDATLAEQETLPPDEVVLLVGNELEHLEVVSLRDDLQALIERDALLMPRYRPYRQEFCFGYDEPCEYAGVFVQGKIDRIDIDGLGNAVVIDYKGSLGKSYAGNEAVEQDIDLPRKVQALIYAQIVRRTCGLTPQAALYLSYRKPDIAGAYNHRVFDPTTDIPGIDADACAVPDFCEVLDRVEELIKQKIACLHEGDVLADPIDSDACSYCPLTFCSARDGLEGGVS